MTLQWHKRGYGLNTAHYLSRDGAAVAMIDVQTILEPKRKLKVIAHAGGKQAPFMSVSRAKLWVEAELQKS
jgi:hypothetical protein